MLLLISGGTTAVKKFNNGNLGGLITPRGGSKTEDYQSWAMDNDCYNGLDERAYFWRLEELRGRPGCLFVVVPDVVFDAKGTLERFHQYKEQVRSYGFPLAFVAQNGIENMEIPWNEFDCLFIGGDTNYKIGPVAQKLVAEAHSRGKWVHMGRVNSVKRATYAQSIGCDSIDGTGFSQFGNEKIPRILPHLGVIQQRLLDV